MQRRRHWNDTRDQVRMRLDNLTQRSTRGWLIRFGLGAGVSALAGVVSLLTNPRLGGIFLAFPAILLVSLTLVPRHENARKAHTARGSALGALGLLAFAIVFAATVTRWPLWAVLTAACLSWMFVAFGGYLIATRAGRARSRYQTPGHNSPSGG